MKRIVLFLLAFILFVAALPAPVSKAIMSCVASAGK
jgi:hypothetical protein